MTATYNARAFIDRLHGSLSEQTLHDFEWVVVDDFSTDDTVDYLKTLPSPGTGGMRLYRLPGNSGGGLAVATGVAKATGEAVVIIDHDDELFPDALRSVAENWHLIRKDASLAGLFFRIVDPASDSMIGAPLAPGTRFSLSWMSNCRADIHDGSFALKAEDAKRHFAPEVMENVCLFGAPLTEMSQDKTFLVADAGPLRFYHRDNPSSQTNSVKVSRKVVYSYARLLDLADRWYLRQPMRWLRHTLALIRFSMFVHRNPFHHLRHMKRSLPKLLSLLLTPAGVASSLLGRKPRLVDFPVLPIPSLRSLPDLRSSPATVTAGVDTRDEAHLP
ncbi:glycosyltransferase family 2 protein [Sphingomonas parva]|uniref:glycosyltransferase family 2 protein n=1 Tax=Sphingomonas parva TaxID=2555898 RepID=UPI0014305F5D|nr:glycosyltransferase [Sphingomonas parva]